MRLCVVSPFPPQISGIGQYGWSMVQGLARTNRFRAITVLAGGREQGSVGPLPLDSPARRQRVWARDDLQTALRLVRAIRAEKPDVAWFNLGFTVFGDSRAANFLGLMTPALTRRAGIPVVVTLHEIFEATSPQALGVRNGWATRWGARTATTLLLQADAVCVTLRRYQDQLRARYGARHVLHIPHGAFVTPEFLPHPASAPARDILILATFAPHKGLPVLLEAFDRVRRVYPDASLTVAGSDHPRFPGYLARLRASVNGAPGIRWLGTQSEAQLREVFARASVVALPYTATTGASSVLHRAAAFGRPIVASRLPDMEAAAHEEGLLVDYVPPADPEALAQTLIRLLGDPTRRASVAVHNLVAMRAMSLDRTCARYVSLFEQTVRASRGQ